MSTSKLPGSPTLSAPEAVQPLDRIAISTVGELFGGVERHVLGLIRGLADRGVATLLIVFHDGELAAQARLLGIDPQVMSPSIASTVSTSRKVGRLLKENGIGVAHVHGYKATVVCALARQVHRFSLVKTEHGLPEPMAAGPIQGLRNRLYYFSDKTATRNSHAVVCYVTEDLKAAYGRAHSGLRTHVIPNGVASMEPDAFKRPVELNPDWFNLLIVGRLDLVKGHHLGIQAMAALAQDTTTHLHLIGTGPLEQNLKDLAKSLGLEDRTHFIGFRRNIYDYIAHCDALLMPSLHEGLPYTLLEAMALGVPVIASRVGGLAEVIADGSTGLLIPAQDASALAGAIRQLFRDRSLRSQLGEGGRRAQRAHYSLESMSDRYFRIYQEVGRQQR